MAKIIGMNGGRELPPQQKQPTIDLSQAKEMMCTECGGTVFIPGTKFLTISKLITGDVKDAIIPMEIYLCGDCGEINQQLLPEELKVIKSE